MIQCVPAGCYRQTRGNLHVTSEPAEVIVGVLTLDTTVEALEGGLCSLETHSHTPSG